MKATENIWRTADHRYVPTGHVDATVLAYAAGDDTPDHVVEAFEAARTEQPADGGRGGSLKSGVQPANKMRGPDGDKTAGGPQTPLAPPAPVVPPRSGAGSGRDEWAAYAAEHQVDVTDDMKRDDIIAALEAANVPTTRPEA